MPILQEGIHFRLVGCLGARMVRALHATWRMHTVDPGGVRPRVRSAADPLIVTFWHRHILIMLAHHRNFPVCVPVSRHRDGEYVAQVMDQFGLASVRGSTTRGGLEVIRGPMSLMQDGWSPAYTPDGPRGPRFSVQPGVALLSRRTGTPICPIGMAADRAWVLSSWDGFVIPKPMAHVGMAFGPLLQPDDYDDIPAMCEALRAALFSADEAAARAIEQDAPAAGPGAEVHRSRRGPEGH
jgi:lysophospholipid acyltransferase (LPLAT)-like uncharacterized protein